MRTGDPIETDVDYIMKRRSAGHDIEHIVTGFGANQLGEHALALLSSVGSTRFLSPRLVKNVNMATAFVTAASFMRNAIHYPAVMPHLYAASQKAIEMGLALPCPLYMVDWDKYLDSMIADICADLGIVHNDNTKWQDLDHLLRG
jgi:ubiquinone biosynthesis protein Coq4